MAFGHQPRPNPDYEPQGAGGLNTGYGQRNQYQQYRYANRTPYEQPRYQYAQPGAGAAFDAQVAYSYEEARRVSVTKAYAEMTVGLLVTAAVAVIGQATGAYYAFLMHTGMLGMIGLCVAQIALAVLLGARVMTMRTSTARALFYGYAALMGFTLSSVFMVYSLGSIGVALGITAAFFFVLTMFGMTTKFDMLKAGPILMVGLIVLVVSQLLLAFIPGVSGMTQVMCALGVVLFAGMTIYDAQSTRALFAQYEAQGPEAVKRISILCALNLYLDFVNMFLYILQLLGDRE